MPKFGGPAVILGFLVSTIYLLIVMSAENSINLLLVVLAIILARVVFPTPGGPQKIIEEIILNDYLKNKKKSRFNILKNYLSNSNPKSKFKNRYQVENAIRKINDEMEDAQKEFSKLFQNNEKDYN